MSSVSDTTTLSLSFSPEELHDFREVMHVLMHTGEKIAYPDGVRQSVTALFRAFKDQDEEYSKNSFLGHGLYEAKVSQLDALAVVLFLALKQAHSDQRALLVSADGRWILDKLFATAEMLRDKTDEAIDNYLTNL